MQEEARDLLTEQEVMLIDEMSEKWMDTRGVQQGLATSKGMFYEGVLIILEHSKSKFTKCFALHALSVEINVSWGRSLKPLELTERVKQISRLFLEEVKRKEVSEIDRQELIESFAAVFVECAKLGKTLRSIFQLLVESAIQDQKIASSVIHLFLALQLEPSQKEKESSLSTSKTSTYKRKTQIRGKSGRENVSINIADITESIQDLCFFILESYLEQPSSVSLSMCKSSLKVVAKYNKGTRDISANRLEVLMKLICQPTLRDYSLECLALTKKSKEVMLRINIEIREFFPIDSNVLSDLQVLKENFPEQQVILFQRMCTSINNIQISYLDQWLSERSCGSIAKDAEVEKIILEALNYAQRLSCIETAEIRSYEFFQKLIAFIGSHGNAVLLLKESIIDVVSRLAYQLVSYFRQPNFNGSHKQSVFAITEVSSEGEVIVTRSEAKFDEARYKAQTTLLNTIVYTYYEIVHQLCITKFERLIDGSEWNIMNLESLQFAIGEISDCINDDTRRKEFCLNTIRRYLNLIETRRNKVAKVLVINGFLYCCSRFSALMKANRNVFETSLRKVVEFLADHTIQPVVEIGLIYFECFCAKYAALISEQTPTSPTSLFSSLAETVELTTSKLSYSQCKSFFDCLIDVVVRTAELPQSTTEQVKEMLQILLAKLFHRIDEFFMDLTSIITKPQIMLQLAFDVCETASRRLPNHFGKLFGRLQNQEGKRQNLLGFIQGSDRWSRVSDVLMFLDEKVSQFSTGEEGSLLSNLTSIRRSLVMILGNSILEGNSSLSEITQQITSSYSVLPASTREPAIIRLFTRLLETNTFGETAANAIALQYYQSCYDKSEGEVRDSKKYQTQFIRTLATLHPILGRQAIASGIGEEMFELGMINNQEGERVDAMQALLAVLQQETNLKNQENSGERKRLTGVLQNANISVLCFLCSDNKSLSDVAAEVLRYTLMLNWDNNIIGCEEFAKKFNEQLGELGIFTFETLRMVLDDLKQHVNNSITFKERSKELLFSLSL